MLNVVTEEVGISSTTESSQQPQLSSLPAPLEQHHPTTSDEIHNSFHTNDDHTKPIPKLSKPSVTPQQPQNTSFRESPPSIKYTYHHRTNIAADPTKVFTDDEKKNDTDPVVVLQKLHKIATKATVLRKAGCRSRVHHHQNHHPIEMCLERTNNPKVVMIPSSSSSTSSSPRGSPSTILSTEAPRASMEAITKACIGTTTSYSLDETESTFESSSSLSSFEPRSPVRTKDDETSFSPPPPPPHEHHLAAKQQQPQHSKQPSILRKGRFSPAAGSPSPSRLPSTGQRVRGLWSPSIELFREDDNDDDEDDNNNDGDGDHRATSTSRGDGRSPPQLPLLREANFASVRDETLARIFCYLPLADLLRAGMVSRRWRHEIHKTGGMEGTARDYPGVQQQQGKKLQDGRENKNKKKIHHRSERHRLWERVDASDFIQEHYDRFLDVATKRQLEQQQQAQQQTNLSKEGVPSAKMESKKRITDPARWARLQTGRALGNVLRSKTMMPTGSASSSARPFAIRSLILRNVGTKLSSDHLDDFLPSSVLSSLEELILEGFKDLTDTHVHVLLLTTLAKVVTTKRWKNHPTNGGGTSKLEVLSLENCLRLTNKVLGSVAKICSNEHLRKLSIRGCPRIDSIEALSDFMVTKLVISRNNSEADTAAATSAVASRGVPRDLSFIPTTKDSATFSRAERALPSTVLLVQESSPLPTAPPSKPAGAALASFFAPPLPSLPQEEQREITALPANPPRSGTMSSLFEPPMPSSQARDTTPSTVPTTTALGAFFLSPPPRKQHEPSTSKPMRPSDLASLFAPPPSRKLHKPVPPNNLASMFAPPPPRKQRPKEPPLGVASLFVPPASTTAKAKRFMSGERCSSSSSSTSKSSLASLFDLPGTSPTRRNNEESIRILPPPPPVTMNIPDVSSLLPKQEHPLLRPDVGSTPNNHRQGNSISSSTTTTAVSKRYHRHQRSLSNGKMPFPAALLPDLESIIHHNKNDNETITNHDGSTDPLKNSAGVRSVSSDNNIYAPAIVVGSLGILDIRGTGVTPASLESCLWALTHHDSPAGRATTPTTSTEQQQDLQPRSWCKVWFEALHLGGSHSAAEHDSNHPCWTGQALARLEPLLAMDEMERSGSSNSSSNNNTNRDTAKSSIEEISYLASKQ